MAHFSAVRASWSHVFSRTEIARLFGHTSRALAFACTQLEVNTTVDALAKSAGTTEKGTTMEGLAAAAKALGLKAEGIQAGREALSKMQCPAISLWNGNHYVAVLKLSGGPGDGGTAVIHDPNEAGEKAVSQEYLLTHSSGYLLTLQK